MSAYVVDRQHIDALVALAVRNSGYDTLRWFTVSDQELRTLDMTALRAVTREARHDTADEIGRMLWAENVKSIHYRYPDTIDGENLPGPIDFTEADVLTYVWPFSTRVPSAVAGLKAIAGYEYQACEHPEWLTSEARNFCEALRHRLITNLPGYEDADWEITSLAS